MEGKECSRGKLVDKMELNYVVVGAESRGRPAPRSARIVATERNYIYG